MTLRTDIQQEISEIFSTSWNERDGNVVPTDDSISLGNVAVKLTATVLYADLAGSTRMVDGHASFVSAEIYKSFLHCAAKIIRSEDGEITAYGGDRIMAVYIDQRKNTRAVRSAMKIRWAILNIVNPAISKQYPKTAEKVNHVIGIDTSNLFIAKTGVRGANDLVWVGRAANYAAKLTELPPSYSTYITKEVYDVLADDGKTSDGGQSMWEAVRWNSFDNRIIYRSSWSWQIE
jgi:class 3 adenylate cyclase